MRTGKPIKTSVSISHPYRTIVRRRPSGAPAEHRVIDPLMREHKPKVYILHEERETWTATLAIPSGPKSLRRITFRWSPDWRHLCSKKHGKVHPGLIRRSGQASYQFHSFLRKEVIQPQVPLRLPCYDFTPVADPTVVACLLAVSAAPSGRTNSHGVTGGVYKARERIHRGVLIRDY